MRPRPRERVIVPSLAAIATLTTLATIGPVFSGQSWLITSVVVVTAIGAGGVVLRALGLAQAYVSLVQLLIGVYALLVLTCHPTMIAGMLPTEDSIEQLMGLLSEGALTARTQVAPIPPTDGTAALLALLVIPVAVLVDDFAVTGRPAVTGIPLLTLFAICAAIVRHPISMWLVAPPLISFLLLLWLADTESRPARRGLAGLTSLLGTGLILALAISAAAAVTAVVRLPDGGIFAVPGTSRTPDETVARTTDLAGQLSRGEPIALFTVTTDDPAPYYLRTLVLESWQTAGWRFTNTQAADVDLRALPPAQLSNATATTHATIEVEKYSDIFAPTYYAPVDIDLQGARYDIDKSVVYTDDKGDVQGQTYDVTSSVPRPTAAELSAAGFDVPAGLANNLVTPNDVDDAVIALTESVVGDAATPWEVALALDGFFSDPQSGFTYSLEVPAPEGADPLASFLDKRVGFCEQYASAMASMFRIAGVPARVVIGYTNGELNDDGAYEITTDDAHAWVEAYFAGVGWVSFDPTPIGTRSVPLPYVPSDQDLPDADGSETPDAPETAPAETAPETPSDALPPDQGTSADDAQDAGATVAELRRWIILALVAAVLALPAAVRHVRWRRRLAAASSGGRSGAAAAWAEIGELAEGLGAPARTTLSERAQSTRWARQLGAASEDLTVIGAAAERARYGTGEDIAPVGDELDRARGAIRARAGAIRWWAAAVLPHALRRRLRPRRK